VDHHLPGFKKAAGKVPSPFEMMKLNIIVFYNYDHTVCSALVPPYKIACGLQVILWKWENVFNGIKRQIFVPKFCLLA